MEFLVLLFSQGWALCSRAQLAATATAATAACGSGVRRTLRPAAFGLVRANRDGLGGD